MKRQKLFRIVWLLLYLLLSSIKGYMLVAALIFTYEHLFTIAINKIVVTIFIILGVCAAIYSFILKLPHWKRNADTFCLLNNKDLFIIVALVFLFFANIVCAIWLTSSIELL